MDKNKDLVFTHSVDHLFVEYFVHEHHAFDCLAFGDSNVDLFEGHRPVRVVEVKGILRLDPQKCCHILVVRERRREGHYTH